MTVESIGNVSRFFLRCGLRHGKQSKFVRPGGDLSGSELNPAVSLEPSRQTIENQIRRMRLDREIAFGLLSRPMVRRDERLNVRRIGLLPS